MKRILFSIVCISLISAAFAKADVSDKNAQNPLLPGNVSQALPSLGFTGTKESNIGATVRNAAAIENKDLAEILKPTDSQRAKGIICMRFDNVAKSRLDVLLERPMITMKVGDMIVWNIAARDGSYKALHDGLTPLSTRSSVSMVISTQIAGVRYGTTLLMSMMFFTLGQGEQSNIFSELYPFVVPVGGYLKSRVAKDSNSVNISPVEEMFFNTSDGKVTMFGLISTSDNNEETYILHDRVILPKKVWAPYTVANIVASDGQNVIIGAGSRLQVALTVDPNDEFRGWSLLGCPGSTITLQPGTTIVWNSIELGGADNKSATFTIGLDGESLMIESVKEGSLVFRHKNDKGEPIRGILRQGEKGIFKGARD